MHTADPSTIRSMSSSSPALLNGRYRVDEPIGHGGMSTVYLAFDTTLERPVAIKMMHRDVARDADQLERFRREAKAIAKLQSPYVVGVIDAGEEDHAPYIVLEYVEGETLKERIKRLERLAVPEAVAYAIEVARGLQSAHDRHIVHRDVKPQNVLLDEDGAARVTDFGIARSLTEEGLTADGRVLGTTDYVSPEQALGHAVTPQSDLYSLGVVLFEMLTGDVPFHGENQVAIAMHHVRDELPDVQSRRPEVSSALAAIVDRATEKDLELPLPERRRADRRPRGRAGDRDGAHGAAHRRGDDGVPLAAGRQAPAGSRPHPASVALDRRDRDRRRDRRHRLRAAGQAGRARHRDADRQARRRLRAVLTRARTAPRTTTRSAATGSTRSRPLRRSTATSSRPGRPRPTRTGTWRPSRASGSRSTPSRRSRRAVSTS